MTFFSVSIVKAACDRVRLPRGTVESRFKKDFGNDQNLS